MEGLVRFELGLYFILLKSQKLSKKVGKKAKEFSENLLTVEWLFNYNMSNS